ncbi:MAG: BLUF domain-containing protein [Aestuariivita sp.]|nr:BLUF domain-containing protein [Aestuariivita sp.]MCY4288384.1 BLUF domain-containing protein [Aestuariivita sp.]MCY4346370.1 BLUF domain-containing protein [Aestuariivita sp.]
MKYIVYVSQAYRPMSADELSSLLKHSRGRNLDDEISGLLIYRFNRDYGRGNFVQVLEGPTSKIDDVWQRISSDPRHHTIVMVEECPIEQRMFKDWSMGFKNVTAADLEGIAGFSDLGSDQFWKEVSPTSAAGALELLRSFYDAGCHYSDIA